MQDEKATRELQREERLRRDTAERVRMLDERWLWMRERIGHQEWGNLLRWRKIWIGLHSARVVAGILTIYFALVFGLAVLYNLFAHRPVMEEVRLHYAHLLAPLGVVLVSLALRASDLYRVQILERLMWQGHSPDAVNDALWAEHEATALVQAAPQIVEQSRLLDEKEAGPPWWRTEVSGLHLLLVVALALAVISGLVVGLQNSLMWRVSFAVAVIGGVAKAGYWLIWAVAAPGTRRGMLRVYRWCGTLVGTVAVILAGFATSLVCSLFLALLEKFA